MKTWFAKFRISTALDSGRPLPLWVSHRLSSCEELRRFARQMSELDSALQKGQPTQTRGTIHGSIMHAVRSVERARGVAPRHVNWLRWLPVPAAAVLALCAACWFWLPQSSSRALPSLTDAFQAGEQITDMLPTQLVDPLNEEWQRVNMDLENTQRFLLAAVPF